MGRLTPPECGLCEGKGLNSTMYSALLVCFILGASGSTQRKMKGGKVTPTHLYANQSGWLCGNLVVPGGGLPGPTPAAGVQCVQVQLLQVRAIELGGGRLRGVQVRAVGKASGLCLWVLLSLSERPFYHRSKSCFIS